MHCGMEAHLVLARLKHFLGRPARRKVSVRDDALVGVEEAVELCLVRRVIQRHVDSGEAEGDCACVGQQRCVEGKRRSMGQHGTAAGLCVTQGTVPFSLRLNL